MANLLNNQDSMMADIVAQLNHQNAKQLLLQQELDTIKCKLEKASKTLAQKDQIIGSLEQDLEHMIDQLGKIKNNNLKERQWLDHPAAPISVEATVIA